MDCAYMIALLTLLNAECPVEQAEADACNLMLVDVAAWVNANCGGASTSTEKDALAKYSTFVKQKLERARKLVGALELVDKMGAGCGCK